MQVQEVLQGSEGLTVETELPEIPDLRERVGPTEPMARPEKLGATAPMGQLAPLEETVPTELTAGTESTDVTELKESKGQ